MTIKELHTMNFNEAVAKLMEEHDNITTYEELQEFAIRRIKDQMLFLAIHILKALDEEPYDFYDYDYCMGTLDTPKPILVPTDLEVYCEEE